MALDEEKENIIKQIELIMISYKVNFLAEAALDYIKRPIRIIHSNKTKEQIENFNKEYTLSIEDTNKNFHFEIIEDIINEEGKPYILFLDHDMMWHNDSFDIFIDTLIDSIKNNPNTLIFTPHAIHSKFEGSIFDTAPFFAVKRDNRLKERKSWLPNFGNKWEKGKDTGQELAKKLMIENKNNVVKVDISFIDYNNWHLGSSWLYSKNNWRGNIREKDFKGQFHVKNRMNKFLKENNVNIKDFEIEIIKDYKAYSHYLNYKKIEDKRIMPIVNENVSIAGIMHIGKDVTLDYLYFDRLKKLTDKTVVLLDNFNLDIDIDADYIIALNSKEELKWNDMMNRLFSTIASANLNVDWMLSIDSDEDIDYRIKDKEDLKNIIIEAEKKDYNCISFALRELWEKRDEYRSDNYWGKKRRPRLVKNFFKNKNLLLKPGLYSKRLHSTPKFYNVKMNIMESEYEIYHYGCFTKELREKRVSKYKKEDPGCLFQSTYDYMLDENGLEIKKIDGKNEPNS